MNRTCDNIDVKQLIDESSLSPLQVWILVLCALVIVLDGFDIQAIAFAGPALAQEWNIEMSGLGPILVSGLVGMAVGALCLGYAGDRWGRKTVIVASVFFFGLMTLVTVRAENPNQLILLRFLTGLGFGGALPNATALISEYMPTRLRNLCISIIFLGVPLGGVFGGLLAAEMIPAYGWRSIFVLGGVLPLLLSLVLLFAMPESVQFMLRKTNVPTAKIRTILQRIDKKRRYITDGNDLGNDLGSGIKTSRPAKQESQADVNIAELFSPDYRRDTFLLWAIFAINLLGIYFLFSWLPSLMVDIGFDISQASNIAAILNAGGAIGTLVLAGLITRYGSKSMLALFYTGSAVGTAMLGYFSVFPAVGADERSLLFTLISLTAFITGFFIIGAQIGMNALAASVYPTYIRASGIGWALGIGRLGSILGPLVGGVLLAINLDRSLYFLIFALVIAVAVVACLFVTRHQSPMLKNRASS